MSGFPYSPDPRIAEAQARARQAAAIEEQKRYSLLRHGGSSHEIKSLNQLRGQLGYRPIPEDEFPRRK
ncbi:MAG TPA: hypothetical protein VFI90_20610 [Rubrobacter sp.]|nr:hypothetical protein [Rubrobacter sp.]